ncbi:MAG: GIY-YIG nuclease family protein [Gemmatimonadetes bacterium]|nr:GIY-YIG nuclease family protein [Gemmatimonadota bacterium]MYG22757.1 GIY-YIG nuclease family protein [Gemmatimonadota bacterium]MYJ39076.1 GIY-YIG nuclease family protein [Gemmatimonadota bacterium]
MGGPPLPASPDRRMKETPEVAALYAGVAKVLDTLCPNGRRVGDCKHGVYLFYDYDREPIYVGRTREKLRTRIRRHLTNQRTDAVAMSVLDPFEVADIELWPFWDMPTSRAEVDDILHRAEYTVYQRALEQSAFKVILNEAEIPATDLIPLPPSVKASILGGEARRQREHPDVRLARRARTIANLARVISERKVKVGIRRTLWAQARRLDRLAEKRLKEFNGG